jgi:predicted DNA-binding antitoxin AbrB/MazE fold protein
MKTIHAIFEKGIFRPLETVELADRTEVEFEPKVVGVKEPKPGSMEAIYEVMSRRFNSGETDIAERHNEHQP